MKKDNDDEIDAGKIQQFTPNSLLHALRGSRCSWCPGPFYLLQTPAKVVILEEQTHKARHIDLETCHIPLNVRAVVVRRDQPCHC